MESGKYTVILEPAASVGLLGNIVRNFAQRAADEGRSFLSYKPKEGEDAQKAPKNKLGQKMFDERVNIYTDPGHPITPAAPFSGDESNNASQYGQRVKAGISLLGGKTQH
jgi:predicted Zn-dependent protease